MKNVKKRQAHMRVVQIWDKDKMSQGIGVELLDEGNGEEKEAQEIVFTDPEAAAKAIVDFFNPEDGNSIHHQ